MDIDRVCDVLRAHYRIHYDAPILIDDINETVGFEKQYLVTCIKLLSAGTALVLPTDLMTEGAKITVPEQLFHFDHFAEIAESFLPHFFPEYFERKTEPNGNETAFDRHPETTVPEQSSHSHHCAASTEGSLRQSIPKNRARKTKPHGNTVVNARKRDEILEAAKLGFKRFPLECRARNGRVQATKIAKCIDLHSHLLFPQYDGEPPLALRTMENLIRKNMHLFN